MILCHCAVVTDHDVHEAIEAGATDVCALAETCGTSRACGGCLPELRRELAAHGLPTDDGLDAQTIQMILAAREELAASPTAAS